MSAAVGNDDPMIPRKIGDLVTPDLGISKTAMNEQDGVAFAIFGVITS